MVLMSGLSNLAPVFHPLFPHKLFSSPLLPSLHHNKLPSYPHQKHLRICASLSNKSRCSRRVKSNEDLYNDIREFLSTVGLPHDHVPSMKELAEHGRQDLANIVRRRGYKFIRELLTSTGETRINNTIVGEKLTGEKDITGDYEATQRKECGKCSAKDASILSQDVDVIECAEDVSFSLGAAGANLLKDNFNAAETERKANSDDISGGPESLTYPSLQEKVAKFIQDGELDDIEDNGFDLENERTSEDSTAITESQNAIESNSVSTSGLQNKVVVYGAEIVNGNVASSCHQVEHTVPETYSSRIESHSTEEETTKGSKEDQEVEAEKVENQVEINRLKLILHQKELELTQLKEEIEKEKLALSILQTKADKEISKAQELILEKDAELQAAEESLSELKEVEILYWGEGEVVEVAGSFNGWHQKINMDSQPYSGISEPSGSRKSRLWRTVLWLYPGVYEIKFIVDGHWTIDPQRESVTRGTINNNILVVG